MQILATEILHIIRRNKNNRRFLQELLAAALALEKAISKK